jgi:hypothetical protein
MKTKCMATKKLPTVKKSEFTATVKASLEGPMKLIWHLDQNCSFRKPGLAMNTIPLKQCFKASVHLSEVMSVAHLSQTSGKINHIHIFSCHFHWLRHSILIERSLYILDHHF